MSQNTSQVSTEVQDSSDIAESIPSEPSPDPQSPAMDYTKSKLFLETPQTDMVTLEIGMGSSMVSALVHRSIISQKSPILSILFNYLSDPDQPNPTSLHLAAEDPALFTLLLTYIYTSSVLPTLSTNKKPTQPSPPIYTPPTVNGAVKDHLISTFKTLSSTPLYFPFLSPFQTTIPQKLVLWSHLIEHPIDFTIMQSKLIQGIYKDISSIDRDFELLYHNQLKFWTHQNNALSQYVVLADEFRKEYWKETISAGMRPKDWKGYDDGLASGFGKGRKMEMPKTHLQLQIEKMTAVSIQLPELTLIDLYILALRYEVADLQDHVVTSLISGYIEKNTHPRFEVIETYYPSMTKKMVPLKRFLVKSVAYHLLTLPPPSSSSPSPDPDSLNSTANIYKLIASNEELGIDIFRLIRGRGGIALGDPRKGGFCEFHVHGMGKCALGGNGERQNGQGMKRKAREVDMEGWF